MFFRAIAMADGDDAAIKSTNSLAASQARFGLFDWLDHRSAYNQEFFPQPLLVDDTGLEDDEVELGYLHTKANGQHSDTVTAGAQASIGLLTFEVTVPYEHEADSDDSSDGIGDINLEARNPLFQFVSPSGFCDTTLGVATELGIPVNTKLSKNAELDPEIFNDLKLGNRLSIQTVLGYDILFGGGDQGGAQSFEYGVVFGYLISQRELRLPGMRQLTPLLELSGETGLNKDESGQNSLLGSVGLRLDLRPIGEMQPSIGISYVFPIDSGAREEVHWGIATSLELEF
jgi:hypothetical protein